MGRLLIFTKDHPPKGEMIHVNIPMAEMLLAVDEKRRAKSLEQCLLKIVRQKSANVVLTDFDVMFNPAYNVDVLKILISVCKVSPFCVLWPGTFEHGKLLYADESSPDHHVFQIKNYDITCVV